MPSQMHTPSTPTRPQAPVQVPALRVKMQIKAGGKHPQHNETLVCIPRPAAGLKVKTHVKAGGVLVPD